MLGFGELGERIGEWDEDRRIMQMSQERKKDNINKNPPTILEEEKEEQESAISAKEVANLEYPELVRGV